MAEERETLLVEEFRKANADTLSQFLKHMSHHIFSSHLQNIHDLSRKLTPEYTTKEIENCKNKLKLLVDFTKECSGIFINQLEFSAETTTSYNKQIDRKYNMTVAKSTFVAANRVILTYLLKRWENLPNNTAN
jgi:light-regulated signal transduction histidine kinase (bacteriophytochrome)